jgi:hypothetical protein
MQFCQASKAVFIHEALKLYFLASLTYLLLSITGTLYVSTIGKLGSIID